MTFVPRLSICALLLLPAACARVEQIGKAPDFTPTEGTNAYMAMSSLPFPEETQREMASDQASLWSGGRSSLLGDRRAERRGDILTVVIEIDDKAEISNSTDRSRSGTESMKIPSLLGIPQRLNPELPAGASLNEAVSTASSSGSSGDGSVRRNEKLTLRVAATITDVLANGVVRIEGTQEVRVNFEMRELLVNGYVRPEDISRQNEITYDKVASARISYGGRGQITDMQQPRYGQQIADIILPF
ncbi:flagellar basal body L-ring protein FlgH [Actibacterium lipolyticum]|uniref:Flagellar L-ring protein n=1 Tax=Actibacterium lipolyticum TaxID=1524263 RepID=A0A238KZA6_9RHOB|nr:flagellar basal body L-ring protein FlgH [Actibacterium lipolyticum]SMX47416.1 Flagellar L-ring protein precursor [Actibacterium lipolyticum]